MLKSEKRTLGDQTYEHLLTGICDLTYPPGHKLSEAQVAQAFGVSRAPVRDALFAPGTPRFRPHHPAGWNHRAQHRLEAGTGYLPIAHGVGILCRQKSS